MDDPATFVSFDGFTANVYTTKQLIREKKDEVSQLEERLDRLQKVRVIQETSIRSIKVTKREELQREIYESHEEEKKELDSVAAAFRTREKPLMERLSFLQREIDSAEGAIAPIRKLPAEILSNIFQEFVSLNQPPWFLTTISKSWRQIALATPCLWAHLQFASSISFFYRDDQDQWLVKGKRRYSEGRRLVYRNVQDLRLLATMSGAVPLYVILYSHDVEDDGLEEILGLLLAEPISSRLASLSITHDLTRCDVGQLDMGFFPLLHTLSIKSVSLNSPKPKQLLKRIIARSSRVVNFTSNLTLDEVLSQHRFWNPLRVIELGYQTSPRDWNAIIPRLTSIDTLNRLPSSWPDEETPVVTLSFIKSIRLECQPEFLARIRLPGLQKLHWIVTNTVNILNNPYDRRWDLSFPELIHIVIDCADPA